MSFLDTGNDGKRHRTNEEDNLLMMVWKYENKAKIILHIVLVLLFLAASVFFVKLASCKAGT